MRRAGGARSYRRCKGCGGHLEACSSPSRTYAGTFYLVIEDVEGYYAKVREQADIAWPLQDTTYGSCEFGVRDCNGYYLAFSQRHIEAVQAERVAS
nr:hypothetical protein [Pseudomonas maumuensis]